MLLRLLLLFTLVPLIEIVLLIQVDRVIGLVGTIALIAATGTLGAFLARREGRRTLQALRSQRTLGGVPSHTLIEGVLVLIAGAVLLTPGVLTDVVGFLLLVPRVRTRVAAWVHERGKQKLAAAAKQRVDAVRAAFNAPSPREDVIDVEFELKDAAPERSSEQPRFDR